MRGPLSTLTASVVTFGRGGIIAPRTSIVVGQLSTLTLSTYDSTDVHTFGNRSTVSGPGTLVIYGIGNAYQTARFDDVTLTVAQTSKTCCFCVSFSFTNLYYSVIKRGRANLYAPFSANSVIFQSAAAYVSGTVTIDNLIIHLATTFYTYDKSSLIKAQNAEFVALEYAHT